MGFSLAAGSRGYSLVVCRLLILVTFLVAEHGLQGAWFSVAEVCMDFSSSVVVVPRL